ncbi:hypothetical protein O181_085306 [Austropuccinia psidii MF-1]|uniref:Uncharacterized protein n=1 Tax=Austropuccinia psidii MF-1 TaxID=1389203 RepID=A0A9Q3IJM4_9BASI|nr:hypothetical protein [Austropuccinia psidii MF-1]
MSGGSQSFPHSPRSVPKNFNVNSEPELIQVNILRAKPFPSGSHRDILVPVQIMVQGRQGRGVGKFPKPLAGRHELLLTHEELCGSGEDHRTVRRVEHIVLKDKVKKIKNWLKNQIISSLDQKKELEITPVWEKEGPVVSTSSKPATEMSKYKPKGPQKKNKGPKNHEGKGRGKDNWHRPYP